jgi:hypothetical protein
MWKYLGWTGPMLVEKVSPVTPLGLVKSSESIFFVGFTLAGISLPVSSFLVLEEYELKLAHLSLHSIRTLASFVHLYKMFVSVRPSLRLHHHFFGLCPSYSGYVRGGYYF